MGDSPATKVLNLESLCTTPNTPPGLLVFPSTSYGQAPCMLFSTA